MIPYKKEFLDPRPILSDEEKFHLHDLSNRYPLDSFTKNERNLEETMVDFVYASSKIEGNEYDRLETRELLLMGRTAGNKLYTDALMLVNMRAGFEFVMNVKQDEKHDVPYIKKIHSILMQNLLSAADVGATRNVPVHVRTGLEIYSPPESHSILNAGINALIQNSREYDDSFERAIYLHCNLAYLQYFRDGNKRTARLLQTSILAQQNILPLFFHEKYIAQYVRSLLEYYETGNYKKYIEFFSANYEFSIFLLAGEKTTLDMGSPEEARKRIEQLPKLAASNGARKIFGTLALQALQRHGGNAQYVNWLEVEMQAIEACLLDGNCTADEIENAIYRYSPACISPDRQTALDGEVRRIMGNLEATGSDIKKHSRPKI